MLSSWAPIGILPVGGNRRIQYHNDCIHSVTFKVECISGGNVRQVKGNDLKLKGSSGELRAAVVLRSRSRGLKKTPTNPDDVVRVIVRNSEEGRTSLVKLLDRYARLVELEECFLLFEELGRKDRWLQALEVFRWMQTRSWYRADNGVYSKLISIMGKKGQIRLAMWLFAEMRNSGCRPDTSVYNSVITAHLHTKDKEKALEKAFGYLEKMKEKPRCQPNLVTYNILLRAYAQAGQVDKVEALFTELQTYKITPDIYTYNGVMDAYGKNGMLTEMETVLTRMKRKKCKPTIITFNLLIDAYGKYKDFSKMERVFESMLHSKEKPTLPTFNSMITNYGRARLIEKAELVYKKMITLQYEPSHVTYECLIMAYGHCGSITKAREKFSEMLDAGIRLQISTLHALLEVYCKNGLLYEADLLFHNAPNMGVEPHASTYKLLYKAYTKANETQLLDKLLKTMEANGVIPNKKFFLEALGTYSSSQSKDRRSDVRNDSSFPEMANHIK
eukprot:Gb_36199 [translate_table: standard]